MLMDIYLICAAVGGAIVFAQLLLSVLAIGAGRGTHHPSTLAHRAAGVARRTLQPARAAPHGAAARPLHSAAQSARAILHDHRALSFFLGLFNFQGMVAGIAVLGLVGLTLSSASLPASLSLSVAILAALVMMALVAAALRLMVSLDRDATIRIDEAVGQIATVYLAIPPHDQGRGKVTLKLQHRLMEFAAVTPSDSPLMTGQKVIVIAVREPSTMEVVPADERLRDLESLNGAPATP